MSLLFSSSNRLARQYRSTVAICTNQKQKQKHQFYQTNQHQTKISANKIEKDRKV